MDTKTMFRTHTKWDSILAFTAMHALAVVALFHFTWKGFWAFMVIQWLTGGLGICLCYHRLLTHRSFTLWKPLEYLLAIFGCLAYQNGPIKWVAIHRLHHARSDQPNDPHSPTKGFWWAHMGWLFRFNEELDLYDRYKKYAPDLAKDPVYRFMNATHGVYQLFLGIALYLWGGWPAVLWGVFFRLVFVWHCTWFVNSAAHIWGYRTWAVEDQSTNNWWVAFLTYGEGWHNNHHAFLRSARHGLASWEWDPTWWTIQGLAAVGLADKIQLPIPELQERYARKQAPPGRTIPLPTIEDSFIDQAAVPKTGI
ncbi:MAG: acyl-CoA desaturase [Candidatus Omnitrophica bacterium CG11_big_fil_rev_8_21_14_0_20_64_10]|nr:MAG: acyl-CoA desaturase [Candidatus Omnitrophica bacterium CG11_big_fil_rev_8_21_14_0_20_64_10]